MTRIYVIVSTIAEFVPGYEAIVWNGVVAPTDTSVGIINQLNSAFTTSLADLQVKVAPRQKEARFASVEWSFYRGSDPIRLSVGI